MLVGLLVVMRWRRFGVFSQTEQFVTRAVRGVVTGPFDEHPGRFAPGSDAQPLAGALDIFVDGEGRQVEGATDLLGMHVARNQPQAFSFSRRQSRKFGVQLGPTLNLYSYSLSVNTFARRACSFWRSGK
jgi:hypothetical protein